MDTGSVAGPRPAGRDRVLKRAYLARLLEEPDWPYRRILDGYRDEGVDELEAHRLSVIIYVDQLQHLRDSYNRRRRVDRHEFPAGLLRCDDLDDHSEDQW